jgi:hypothetical protein
MEGEKSECPDFVLTRKETAGRLRISLRTLTRIERAKKLAPRVRLSDRRYGYRISTVENYLSARTA